MFWGKKQNKYDADRVYSQFYQFGNFPDATQNSWSRINYSLPIYLISLFIRTPTAGMRFDFSWMQGGISIANEIKWPIQGYQNSPTAPGIQAAVNYNGGSADPSMVVNACSLAGNIYYHWNFPVRTDWMKFGVISGNFCQFQIWYTLSPNVNL